MPENIGTITETKAFEQLGILVLDGSGSMATKGETGQPKTDEVNTAVRGLIALLKTSRLKDNFHLAVITFDSRVDDNRVSPTTVTNLDELGDYNPMSGHGGGTHIGDALDKASVVATAFLGVKTSFPRSVVIVLMSDGQNKGGLDPVSVADSIKASGRPITLCCAGYGKGTDVDALTLQKVASDASAYIRAYNPDDLRKFFVASISKLRVSSTAA
jgi:uncharacterized protein YegL